MVAKALPLAAATAAFTAEALLQVCVPRHGFPAVLLSDNGTQFTSATLRGMCKQVGISKVYSSPYHPQENSVVESYMGSLKKGLRALTSPTAGHSVAVWDLHVQALASAYNTTLHVATGFSPFLLEHGRETVLSVLRELDKLRLDQVTAK